MVSKVWVEMIETYCLMDMEFQFGKMKKFWRWMAVWGGAGLGSSNTCNGRLSGRPPAGRNMHCFGNGL